MLLACHPRRIRLLAPAIPIGTLINAAAIILGSLLGLFLRGRFPDRFRAVVYHSIGLCVLVIGLHMALGFDNVLILIFAMLCGGVLGEAVKLDRMLVRAGDLLKRAWAPGTPASPTALSRPPCSSASDPWPSWGPSTRASAATGPSS